MAASQIVPPLEIRLRRLEEMQALFRETLNRITAQQTYFNVKMQGLQSDCEMKFNAILLQSMHLRGVPPAAAQMPPFPERVLKMMEDSQAISVRKLGELEDTLIKNYQTLRQEAYAERESLIDKISAIKRKVENEDNELEVDYRVSLEVSAREELPSTSKSSNELESSMALIPTKPPAYTSQPMFWNIPKVHEHYTKAVEQYESYGTIRTNQSNTTEDGYTFGLLITLNGGKEYPSWNSYLCLAVVALHPKDNECVQWPLECMMTIRIHNPNTKKVIRAKTKYHKFRGPNSKTWLNYFCHLDDVFGVERTFDTPFVHKDSLLISVQLAK